LILPCPSGLRDYMIYSVSIFNSDGMLKRLVLPKAVAGHHWDQFELSEKSRGKSFLVGGAATKINQQIRKFRAAEQLCDQFIFDFGA